MSIKTTKQELKRFATDFHAIDITYLKDNEIRKIKQNEEYFNEIAYSLGIYGTTGLILQGRKTGKYYAILNRTSAIYCI